MANTSIEYRTAKAIHNGLSDSRLNPWGLGMALHALEGGGIQTKIVTGLIIPYVTIRSVDYTYGNFVTDELAELQFSKKVRDIAVALALTNDMMEV